MNDEQVGRVIDDLERTLVVDDPVFVRHFHKVYRCEAINVVVVSSLLAVGAVLLAVGLATAALIPCAIGVAAFVGAVVVDERHKRTRP